MLTGLPLSLLWTNRRARANLFAPDTRATPGRPTNIRTDATALSAGRLQLRGLPVRRLSLSEKSPAFCKTVTIYSRVGALRENHKTNTDTEIITKDLPIPMKIQGGR